MYHVDEIELDYKPRNTIGALMPNLSNGIMMSDFESSFLCGLLKKFKPSKILELGVSHGGSTAVILQCMKELQQPFSMYSIDTRETVHKNPGLEIGYLGLEASELLNIHDYHLYRGVYFPQVVDEIGRDFDFVILDTTHTIPGEVLEFLAVLPFLAPNAVVCLHDLRQNHNGPSEIHAVACAALFNSVVAEKYINTDRRRVLDYPNIGAFKINDDTRTYRNNVIGTLTQTWTSMLDENILEEYTAIIKRYYPEDSIWLYTMAVSMNQETYRKSFLDRNTAKVLRKFHRAFRKQKHPKSTRKQYRLR